MSPRSGRGRRASASGPAGMAPLAPDRLWRAIILTTLLVVPSFWSILAGLVAVGDEADTGPHAGAAIAFGFALLPFVFVAGAFLTQHPSAPGAAARGMGLSLLVGIPVSAVAGDAVTGLVAGVGAGAAIVVRRAPTDALRPRFVAVALASLYTFVIVRLTGAVALLSAPVFPFTSVGMADMIVARRAELDRAAADGAGAAGDGDDDDGGPDLDRSEP